MLNDLGSDKMFIPLNIEDVEVTETNYFFTGKKFLIMGMGVLPYTMLFLFLDYIPNVLVFILFTVIYFLIYSLLVRYVVFEEKRQKESMRSLKQNKISNMSYFWELDKVGSSERDTGMLYKQTDGFSIQRSYIVELDSGSTIGLPNTAIVDYRKAWQEFYRGCYNMDFDIKIYQRRKRPDLSKVLKYYSSLLQDNTKANDMLRQLMQLNIETNYLYSSTDEQRYVVYIEVLNRRVDNMLNFKKILQDILDNSFSRYAIFGEPVILDKLQVDRFFANFYGQITVNSSGLHKSNGFKDLSEYIKVVSILDSKGKQIPFSLLGDMGIDDASLESLKGVSLNRIVDMATRKEEQFKEDVERSLNTKLEEVRSLRRDEKITYEEYLERVKEIEESHKPENVTEETIMNTRQLEKLRKNREKAEERERKKRELEAKKLADSKKWYEEGVEVDVVKEERADKPESKIDEKEFVKGLTLDDILNGGDEDE